MPPRPNVPPVASVRGLGGAVASADQLATQAGIEMLRRGGNAADAAIAANAVMAVVGPHLCGMGGDLFALVHVDGASYALNASGRAGSGADPDRLRTEGARTMPFRHDVRSVTVPGCVDGWVSLHDRFGSLALDELLGPAAELAEHGFPASPLLAGSLRALDAEGRRQLTELAAQADQRGAIVRRPGVARSLRAVATAGRDGFYLGEFGDGLLELGAGEFEPGDLSTPGADWVDPLSTSVFGVDMWTIGPNSQGYLTLGGCRLAEAVGLVDDPGDPAWAHVLIECAAAAGHDRPALLHENADGRELLTRIDERHTEIDPSRAGRRAAPRAVGDTTYLCTVDGAGMGVSLIQSNASGFGSWLVEPNTGINLHNRGMGFSLAPDHPAEYGPGRRPPHTLSPALATRGGELVSVFGTMGGDAQPQILMQVAARLFLHGEGPARALDAARWALRGPETGFDTWADPGSQVVGIEAHAPDAWASGLAQLGHEVRVEPAYTSGFGHAHAITVEDGGVLAGAADPRAVVGSCAAI